MDLGALRAGVARLREMGYTPVLGDHVRRRNGYLAGDDDARAADLERALRNRDLSTIWFARGGSRDGHGC